MAKEEVKPKRGRRTKAEVQQEFDLFSNEESKHNNPKAEELARLQQQELIDSVKDLSSEEMIHKFADLNIEVTKTLGSLSEKIVCEIQLLGKLRQAVELEKQELERLHKIDVAQTALDHLIQDYKEKNEVLEKDHAVKKGMLDAEIERNEAWLKEEEENLAKARKRESEEFEYKKNLERKKAQDKYEEEIRLRDKQTKEKQEALEKSWQQREAELKTREEELTELRQTVESYPEKIQTEVEKASAEAIRRTEAKLAYEIELIKRDSESEKRLAELKIKTLEESLLRHQTQIANMQSQMEDAKKQVQDIAVKAIEGASGAKAFQIALEQSKPRQPVAV
jgi:colicin import membrane protein